jgi:hypothetical protein
MRSVFAMIDGALGAREPDADSRHFVPTRLHRTGAPPNVV